MTIDKLEEARLRSARRRMQIVIGVLATLCLVGLVMFGLSLVDFSAKNASPPLTDPTKNISLEDQEQLRSAFKENLQQYENEFEPLLQDVGLENWNRDGLFEINERKKEMMVFFGSGEYGKALQSLDKLKSGAIAILDEAANIYNESMEKAASFLKEDLYAEAKLHIEKALVIASQSSEALALRDEIEKLPSLLPLLDGAKVARVENDVQKEYDLLQQIVAIAPQRQEETARLREVAELLAQQNFETHISSGFAAIEKAWIKEARYHYHQAKKVAPQRAELALLSTQISTMERSLRLQNYINQAKQAVARDDWHKAKENFVKAAQDAPGNKEVAGGLHQAEQVLAVLDRLNQHLENPYRLTDSGVRDDAEQVLAEAESLSGSSPGLQHRADQLGELLTTVNRSVFVTIISDNQTYIEVRGVGKVGVVSEKTIQLKPGKYTFEGSRDGFKAKLVQVLISYDMENYSIHLVCDEQI